MFVFSSSSSSSADASRANKIDSRHQPVASQLSRHVETRCKTQTGKRTTSDQQSTASRMSYQTGTDPNLISRRQRSPSIEIVADSDLEEPRSCGPRRIRRQGRRTNNRRPVLDKVPSTMPSYYHQSAVSSQPFHWSHVPSDERLAEKYNELRSLLQTKLDLQALTPQVSVVCSLFFNTQGGSEK